MVARKNLCTAEDYSDIHGDNHEERNDEQMNLDYLEKQETNVSHVNGVKRQGLFYQFPYFETSKGYS